MFKKPGYITAIDFKDEHEVREVAQQGLLAAINRANTYTGPLTREDIEDIVKMLDNADRSAKERRLMSKKRLDEYFKELDDKYGGIIEE